MIMEEMNQRMNDAQTQFNELRGEVKGFTQDLKPFFSNGGGLIEDILKKASAQLRKLKHNNRANKDRSG